MSIKALVLDLDGTIYSTYKVRDVDRACISRTHEYLEKRGLLKKIPKWKMLQIDLEIEAGQVSSNIRILSRQLKLDYEHFNNYVNNRDPKEFGIVHDRRLIDLVAKASKRYKIFIFTNAPMVWAKRTIECTGLERLIKPRQIVCLESMGKYLKPDPQAYAMMLKKIGMNGSEVIFLDDKQENIVEAKREGIKSFRVINTIKNKRNSIYSILERICASIK